MLTSHAIYNKTPRRLDHITDEAFKSAELTNYNAQKLYNYIAQKT